MVGPSAGRLTCVAHVAEHAGGGLAHRVVIVDEEDAQRPDVRGLALAGGSGRGAPSVPRPGAPAAARSRPRAPPTFD